MSTEYRAIFSDGSKGDIAAVPQIAARAAELLYPLRFTMMERRRGAWREMGTGRTEQEAAERLFRTSLGLAVGDPS